MLRSRGTARAQVPLGAGNNLAWSNNSSKFGVVGRGVRGSQRKEEARLHRTLKAMMRILDFIPGAIGSLWKAFAWEQCDLVYTFKDHCGMQGSDVNEAREEAGRPTRRLDYRSPAGASG